MNIAERATRVKLILSDVDGVLTDGGVVYDNQGVETKRFSIRDGLAIKMWQKAGHTFGLLTSRNSNIVKVRAAELGIEIVRQGFEHKWPAAQEVISGLGLTPDETCYIGDDLPDLAVISRVGFGVSVSDGAPEVRSAAQYITSTPGGSGAVRELVETILKHQGTWGDLVETFLN